MKECGTGNKPFNCTVQRIQRTRIQVWASDEQDAYTKAMKLASEVTYPSSPFSEVIDVYEAKIEAGK